jgi:hypothetical protein
MRHRKIEVGRKYTATNQDGVTVTGRVSRVDGQRVEFGMTGRLYILMPGWNFDEAQ